LYSLEPVFEAPLYRVCNELLRCEAAHQIRCSIPASHRHRTVDVGVGFGVLCNGGIVLNFEVRQHRLLRAEKHISVAADLSTVCR
jgi:hypothetical protein